MANQTETTQAPVGEANQTPAGKVFERRDVWTLSKEWELQRKPGWHPTIYWYAQAVGKLDSNKDYSDPRSWRYMANVHDVPETDPIPEGISVSPAGRDWKQCQHGNWFFLPWHRLYLHYFEIIIRETIRELFQNGKDLANPADNKLVNPADDWALPFWNYNPQIPETLMLPPEFRAATLPDDQPNLPSKFQSPRSNPLYEKDRDDNLIKGGPLKPDAVEIPIADWTSQYTSQWFQKLTFGGRRSGWNYIGSAGGQIEQGIHGMVHKAVGGSEAIRMDPTTGNLRKVPGLMGALTTAGRDPIFWLHHCNIDRLWEEWRNLPGHILPTDKRWLNQHFKIGFGVTRDTPIVSRQVKEIINTTAEPLRYRYEGVQVPTRDQILVIKDSPPELVAASDTPLPLYPTTPSTTKINLDYVASPKEDWTPSWADSDAEVILPKIYLTFENVTGDREHAGADRYTVHIGLPKDGDPADFSDRLIGHFSTFSVIETSQRDDTHSGEGLTFSFDISTIARQLADKDPQEWNPLTIAVTPEDLTAPPATGTPEDLTEPPATDIPTNISSGLRIGRIALYYE